MTLPAPYYQDEWVTLYHGDCRELMPHIDADVMVTDPPFGQTFVSNRAGRLDAEGIHGDEDATARDAVLDGWGDRPALVFGTWKVGRPEGVRQLLVWDKGNVPGMGDVGLPWGPSHEEIYVMGAGWAKPDSVKRMGSVIRVQAPPTFNKTARGRIHPTEKPVDLMRQLIQRCPAGVIVDPFSGSCSTLRAAKDLGRRCVGVESDERWLSAAVGRLRQEVLL